MSTSLNDLIQRLAILAAPYGYAVAARLLGGIHGTCLELKACRVMSSGALEYARHVSIGDLERRGAVAVADDFTRGARVALSGGAQSATEPAAQSEERSARR